MDLETMKAQVTRWIREAVADDMTIDAINDAIESLWQSLILANVGEYISKKPVRVIADADLIPFDELSAVRFIRYYAISFLQLSVFETDLSDAWLQRAEQVRTQAVQEVRQTSRREEKITPYDPFAIGDMLPR